MASPADGRVGGGAEVAAESPAVSGPTTGSTLGVPLTERILARLPGRRLAWLVAWALVPWLNLAVILAVDAAEWTRAEIRLIDVLNRVAVSLAVVLSLWGAARIAHHLRQLRPALAKVVEEDEQDVERLFAGIDSTLAPLLLTVVTVVVLPLDEILNGEPLDGLIQGVTWLVLGVPLWTVGWVYVTLQMGLNRLGRGHLTLEAYRGDRSLGLRPVGRLAFTGFWMLFGTVGPLVVTGFTDPAGLLLGIGVLAAGLGLFFLSLRRVNRQMVAVKQRELALALDLYLQAYRPVRDQPSLEMLQRQAGLLKAAEDLEKRAERIMEWPFDEPTFARVVTIATSVTAAIIARLILGPIGL
jgi:hypothetical protein